MSLCSAIPAYAVRALPRTVTVTQADGTDITIQLHGDERFHYTTTPEGWLIAQKDGIYYYASAVLDKIVCSDIRVGQPCFFKSKGVPSQFVEQALRASEARAGALRSPVGRIGLDTGFPTEGKIRSLVILAGYKDRQFSSASARDDFDRLLNQEGYSENGASGSARDYYIQNSGGKFIPEFDVVGPVILSGDMKYYGENGEYGSDVRAEEMIIEACRLADKQFNVNFADYDLNNDGVVDNVFVFYAGESEAEGGGDDTIWPHRAELTESVSVDGKRLSVYACTSEINLAGGYPVMAGIGTFCHEFGHVLGWPDLYDTDGSQGGESEGVWDWSLMCTGSYNNEGRTPPSLSAVERMMVGWCEPQELVYTGNYTLEDLQSSNKAYMVKTDTDGEYFVLENRQNTEGWDKYLGGHGLLIWHVDRSSRYVDGYSALDRWYYNCPNNVKEHECLRIITARPGSTDGYQAYMPFPGVSGKTEFTSRSNPENVSWSGAHIDAGLTDITEENGVISFRALTSEAERFPVTGVTIEGRDEAVVNDTVCFKAVIEPSDADNRNVQWKSSDTSVVLIDAGGVALARSVGEAYVCVETEDGGFTDSKLLKVVMRQVFRAKITGSSSVPLSGAEVEISGSGEVYSGKSDESGIVYMEGIPSGSYVAEICHPDYPVQRKGLSLKEGASVCDIVLYTAQEQESGTAAFNVSVTAYETSAYVVWPGSEASEWKVEWYESSEPEKFCSEELDVKKINIEGLKRNTEYSVKISEMGEIVEGDFRTVSFRTSEMTSDFPVMLLHSMYEKGETILLKAGNVPDGAMLEWYVDGKEMESVEFTVTGPEHLIELVIDNGVKTERIIKYIKVLE